MPFKEPFNSYYEQILVPAIKEAGFEAIRADEIYSTRPVIEDIRKEIRESAALVADVTGKNPNVNYELGIAHTLERPVVIISQSIDDIPSDYRHYRVITYGTSELSTLGNKITNTLQNIEERKPPIHLPSEQTSPAWGFLLPIKLLPNTADTLMSRAW